MLLLQDPSQARVRMAHCASYQQSSDASLAFVRPLLLLLTAWDIVVWRSRRGVHLQGRMPLPSGRRDWHIVIGIRDCLMQAGLLRCCCCCCCCCCMELIVVPMEPGQADIVNGQSRELLPKLGEVRVTRMAGCARRQRRSDASVSFEGLLLVMLLLVMLLLRLLLLLGDFFVPPPSKGRLELLVRRAAYCCQSLVRRWCRCTAGRWSFGTCFRPLSAAIAFLSTSSRAYRLRMCTVMMCASSSSHSSPHFPAIALSSLQTKFKILMDEADGGNLQWINPSMRCLTMAADSL